MITWRWLATVSSRSWSFVVMHDADQSPNVETETGGLFRLAVKLMQAESASNEDYVPLVNLMGLIYQIRDDYMNLQSDQVRSHLHVHHPSTNTFLHSTQKTKDFARTLRKANFRSQLSTQSAQTLRIDNS